MIDYYKPDIVALMETWLKVEQEIAVHGRLSLVWSK